MKNKILFLLCIIIFFSFSFAKAETCLKNGFTILTINGIFTDESGAIKNKRVLEDKFLNSYNNQPVVVDYIYNPTHIGGIGDLVDIARQGLFDPKSDYDLVEMLDDASEKVGTQKLLLVGHSQGNFYTNNFYDKVANVTGGVPSESMGVYGVASPDKRVAGDGKYLTSDTDEVIAVTVARLKTILKPNTHIELTKDDGNGHSFSDVYLKYRSKQIVSDIKSSLDKLQANNIQDTNSRCIAPQKISALHKITGIALAVGDNTIGVAVKNTSVALSSLNSAAKSLAGTFLNLAKNGLASVGLYSPSKNNPEPIMAFAEDNTDAVVDNNQTENINIPVDNIPDVVSPVESNTPENNTLENSAPEVSGELDKTNNYQSGGASYEPANETQNPPSENIEIDTISPLITLSGDATVEVFLGDQYVDAGATVTDNKDTDLVVVTSGVVDTTKVGIYVVTYNSVDKSSNQAVPVTRTVNVVLPLADNAPVITLIGDASMTIELNSLYIESGATALDDKDGAVNVEISGAVDIESLGDYKITYTASDKLLHSSSIFRNIKVVNSNPVLSTTSKISFPMIDEHYSDNGRYPDRGKKITPINFQIVYTDVNNKPASSIKIQMRNTDTGVKLNDIELIHASSGFNLLSDGDYTNGEMYTATQTFDVGNYIYSIVAFDKAGNFSKIEESNNLEFQIFPFTYTYIPKYTFGTENGDDRNWQVWGFEGSNIYDWKDLYVNNYLREEFKIQTYSGGSWCTNCIERGVFYHNPLIGFDQSDYFVRSLDGTVQNAGVDRTYQVVIQWDHSGYSYTIFHDNIIDVSDHLNYNQPTEGWWTGWDTSSNGFHRFPSGSWTNVYKSPGGITGGVEMMLMPYPVYDQNAPNGTPTSIPNIQPKSSEKKITSFSFDNLNPKVDGIIDDNNHTVSLTVPYGTDLKSLTQTINVSDKATITPNSSASQDFTNPVKYTVIAEDNTIEYYMVSVVVSQNENSSDDSNNNLLPTITDYSLNDLKQDITVNPVLNHPTISLTSNKNVNWLSLKIEKEDDDGIYKTLQSNDDRCKDWTSTCSKVWEGDTSKGFLKNGSYKINVHTIDANNKEYEGLIPLKIIVIGQTL